MRSLLLSALALASASCSHNVFVVDESGAPIEDATIIPLSRGFSWPAVTTNKAGSARISQDLPTIETLRILKNGYEAPPAVHYDLPKPITVVLKKRQ